VSRSTSQTERAGLLFGVAAYGLWGLMPLYFRAVRDVAPLELLAHRVVWSVVFMAGLLTLLGRWPAVRACLAHRRTRWLLAASTVLIAANWFVFIYGVSIGQVVQNSLGYFINPLLNIVLGVLLFRERLRPAQWLGLALATVGLAYLVAARGEVPWLALGLATTFAGYGVLRKVAPVDSLVGLTVETLYLVPVAVVFLAVWGWQGYLALGAHSLTVDVLLFAAGVVTAVPLLCFGAAARRLPLSTLGFLQYLAPTIQFLLAVLYLGEPFHFEQKVSFGLIWSALAIVTLEGAVRQGRGRGKAGSLPGREARAGGAPPAGRATTPPGGVGRAGARP
jgi:chloramphenicol-sensitive protein RarD